MDQEMVIAPGVTSTFLDGKEANKDVDDVVE